MYCASYLVGAFSSFFLQRQLALLIIKSQEGLSEFIGLARMLNFVNNPQPFKRQFRGDPVEQHRPPAGRNDLYAVVFHRGFEARDPALDQSIVKSP